MFCSKRLKAWQKLLIGMLSGALIGYFFPTFGIALKPIGVIYMNMIKMMIVPLVYFSVISGISSVSDIETFNRLGKRAVLIYAFSTMVAVSIGLIFANVFEPGIGIGKELFSVSSVINNSTVNGNNSMTIIDLLVNIVPSNFFASMSNGNIVQVVFFALFSGIALLCIGERGSPVRELVSSITALVFKMIEIVVSLAPYGVFALIASIIGSSGFSIISALVKFIIVVFSGFLAQYAFSGILILVLTRLNPLLFYRKMMNIYALAIATSSSKATLSTAIDELKTKIGVSNKSASFILPLGAAINMDATAIYLSISAVFIAQVYGVHLALYEYVLIILTTTIGIIGAAGVPSGGAMMLVFVLTSIGLPTEGAIVILGIDRVIDMFRTMININGDCAITVIVDNIEGTLNKERYYSTNIDANSVNNI